MLHKDILVIIDEGHGIDTPGKRCEKYNFYEWEYTRRMGKMLNNLLKAEGYNTYKLNQDKDMKLSDRTKLYNSIQHPHKILISLHGNAHDNESANGLEIFTSPGFSESDKICKVVWEEMIKVTDLRLRGMKEANFWILTKSTCPAMLLELGFYTNKDDVTKMKNDSWVENHLKAMVTGLNKYYESR